MTPFHIEHSITDNIERVVYRPHRPRYKTPILMQHGMWHGAWYWQPWQELLAEWGWESHAYSLPGHGKSPVQRPIRWCTLGYYVKFLAGEVQRFPRLPVLLGHSMGGALIQRYLKHVGDLPAAVLVASWPARNFLPDVCNEVLRDPLSLLGFLTLTSSPAVRNAKRAADILITEGASMTPDELHARLGPESLWVLFQHQPLFWSPPLKTKTPLLWIIGSRDNATAEARNRASAAIYNADYVVVDGAAHNLTLDKKSREAASAVNEWLVKQEIG